MSEKYTIDNAKNDIQNLQEQNLFDFQEIKRLDGLINEYEKRILQAINFNNQINKKIQYEYEKIKKIIIDENVSITLDKKIDDNYLEITNKITDVSSQLLVNESLINNNKNYFKYNKSDNSYITIIFDDYRNDLKDVFNVFKSKNIPFSCAIIGKIAQEKTDNSLLLEIEKNDGEILAHGYNSIPITDSTDESIVIEELQKSKQILEELGLNINGYVKAGGTNALPTLQKWLSLVKKHYFYGSSCGTEEPWFATRYSLANLSLSDIKLKIDQAIKNNQWILFYAHTIDGSENGLNQTKLEDVLDYINSTSIIPITMRDYYDNNSFGNINQERNAIKDSLKNAFNGIKELKGDSNYHFSKNILKNSAFNNFINDITNWNYDKANFPSQIVVTEYDRGICKFIRFNTLDVTKLGSFKISQTLSNIYVTSDVSIRVGLFINQLNGDNTLKLSVYCNYGSGEVKELEKTYTRCYNQYKQEEFTPSISPTTITSITYEIEISHTNTSDITNSTLTWIATPILQLKSVYPWVANISE